MNAKPKVNSKAADFYKRLNQACDESGKVPPYGKGRQTKVAEYLGVSPESARKYFIHPDNGGNIPRRDLMAKLADWLGVEEEWLSLGVDANFTAKEKKEIARRNDGGVYLYYGALSQSGVSCAFSKRDDDVVDIYTIYQGDQSAISVVTGVEISKNEFRFDVQTTSIDSGAEIVGVVRKTFSSFDFIDLSHDLVDKHGSLKSGVITVIIKKDGRNYKTGKSEWQLIKGV